MFVFFLSLFLAKLVAGQSCSKGSSKVLYQNLLMPPGGFTDILQYIKVYMVLIKVGKLEANLFKHMTFFFTLLVQQFYSIFIVQNVNSQCKLTHLALIEMWSCFSGAGVTLETQAV